MVIKENYYIWPSDVENVDLCKYQVKKKDKTVERDAKQLSISLGLAPLFSAKI